MMFVLMIITHVYGGTTVTFSPPMTEPACKAALDWLRSPPEPAYLLGSKCVSTGSSAEAERAH